MFKHYLVPNLIGAYKQRYCIPLIGLLMFMVGSQTVPAQQGVAQDAYAIFQQSCFNCHGPDGAYKETLLMEHNALTTENGPVVPGNPEASRLYNRLLGEGGQLMPLGGPPLPDPQIETVKNWILAGAPDWATPPTTDVNFITPGDVLNTIETHLMSLPSFDRAYARYFTLTHLYNAGEPVRILQEYRKGLSKLINSLSWGATVINPQPIDAQKTILYIDLRHYEWDRNDAWGQIEGAYPYHISFEPPTQTALKQQLGRLQTETNSNIPSVHVDWFLAQGSLPPLYHDLLSLPLTDGELETRLGIDVDGNVRNAPGVRVWRAGFNNSGVSDNNRMVERHASQHGAYWKSYDFAGSVGTQNIFNHPLDFTHDGGEVIFNLPNGLQGYYITTAAGSRLDVAPINIVDNPAASDPRVRNGLSCFGCHTEGMKAVADQVRSVIESNTNPTYDKAQALRLYVEKSEMDALIAKDMERYRGALEATGGAVDDIEPIARFHEAFQGEVDAAYAAASVGLETEAFQEKIRENVGLQNAGLLVLNGPNGSMKRDAWTANFPAIIYALDFPDEQVDSPSQPDQPPGTVVRIPDPNLRAVIAEKLGKSPNAPITVADMESMTRFEYPGALDRGIRDLTGLQFATNLERLILGWWGDRGNQVSDLSPIAGLTNLRRLYLLNNPISDLSPLSGLTNLTELHLNETLVSDLSPISGLTNLASLNIHPTLVTDLSPVAGLINLKSIAFSNKNLSDISPLAGLVSLESIFCWGHAISDLSALRGLTKLERIDFCGGNISDLTPIAGLTGLKKLYLGNEKVADLSPIAGLTGLTHLQLEDNQLTDISALAGLTNLEWLNIARNKIADFSPLDGLSEDLKLVWHGNPGFPKGGPKIEGPWLWVVLPETAGETLKNTDFLSEVSGGAVTETMIATHGAIEGNPVGDSVWTSHRLPPTGQDNILDMLGHEIRYGTVYGSVSLHSPREQQTTMFIGGDRGARVWLNGDLVYERLTWHHNEKYTDFSPVTLQQGLNVLLVAVHTRGNGFFGFAPDAEYTVANTGVGYTISPATIHRDETFTLDIHARNVSNLMGWQFDIVFDPNILEAVDVTEGDFLKTGAATFFQGGSIDNSNGQITGLTAARLSTQGVSGTGPLVKARFKAKASGESEVTLRNLQFVSLGGATIDAIAHGIRITVEEGLTMGDINRDGVVTIVDLVLVAQKLNQTVSADDPADVNGDGVVNIFDLAIVAQAIGNAAAPAAPPVGTDNIDAEMIEAWIAQVRLEDDGSLAFRQGIQNLEKLLASLIPDETALLRNYPNPFNPETWIPYQLAESAEVTLTIYDMNGEIVRRLEVGYKAAGMYQSRSRAAYWDGRNQLGEPLASGLYFYTLKAGEFTATRRMLILK